MGKPPKCHLLRIDQFGGLANFWSASLFPFLDNDSLRAKHDRNVELADQSTNLTQHPFGHVGLMGIVNHNNALGVKNLFEVEKVVIEYSGKEIHMGQPAYHAAARDLFFKYISENPVEYITILLDKVEQGARYAILRFVPRDKISKIGHLVYYAVVVLVLISLGVGVFSPSPLLRPIALTSGFAIAASFAPPVLTLGYFSFGLTMLIYIYLCVSVIAFAIKLSSPADKTCP